MLIRSFLYRFFICSNIYTLLTVYSSIILILILLDVKYHSILTSTLMLFLGFIVWSLLEYGVHRFVFHGTRSTIMLQKFQFFMHGYHHTKPRDPQRLVLPFILTLPLTALIYLLLNNFLIDHREALLAGFLLGYISYDVSHFIIHRLQPTTKFGQYRRAYHYHHHFKNHEQCFGVTTPFWDYIFRTQWKT